MKYNLKPDKPDERDLKMMVSAPTLATSKDLRSLCPPVYDQGNIGSCTANAACAANLMRLGLKSLSLSRLYLYYKERSLEPGDIAEDDGACMRTICKALNKFGVCEERFWPYITEKFAIAPPAEADKNALIYKVNTYHLVGNLFGIKSCIAGGNPVLMGMSIYDSFESAEVAKTGIVPMPTEGEQLLGGHAVLAVGFCDAVSADKTKLLPGSKGYVIVRNSWGPAWGDKGYFYLPYEFFTKYAWNFWKLA